MVRRRGEAFFRLLVLVDAAGAPTRCTAPEKTAEEVFKQAACGVIMQSARFEPAIDAEGTPIASFYSMAMTYSLH